MASFEKINDIFLDALASARTNPYEDTLSTLIKSNIETNRILWSLEDSARMTQAGPEHIAYVKSEIDKYNQFRNNLIQDIDTEIVDQIGITTSNSSEPLYSETPGMMIDRLSILYIKLSILRKLLSMIEEPDLRSEYQAKEKVITAQIDRLGKFIDSYFHKLLSKEASFEIQQSVKLYNDKRLAKYVKLLQQDTNI